MDGFVRIGQVSGLPNGGERLLSVLGRKVLLRRDSHGRLTATELACRHQNADLAAVPRTGNVVVCPRHGWTYDLATGACLNEPTSPLRRYAVVEAEGWVWLGPSITENT